MQPRMSDETFARLQNYAQPLVDTIDTVINRALDALDQIGGRPNRTSIAETRAFNPAAPPNLAHTTVKLVELCGQTLKPNETYWNPLHIAVLRKAWGSKTPGPVVDLILANWVKGRKEEEGYKYYPDMDISIQGQDANAAWRSIYNIASNVGLKLKVVFTWQDNSKAAFPSLTGSLSINI